MILHKFSTCESIRKPEYFTGNVWIQPLVSAPSPTSINMFRVHFEPKSRTNWHTHPLGQILHIESGECWIQSLGGNVLTARAGDTIYIAPNEKHWHGASKNGFMVHIALQGSDKNADVFWEEPVTDEQYYSGRTE